MRVIYIAGTSHSGSTLLDLMLNAHPAIFAAGEVLKLNRQLQVKDARRGIRAPCSCGAPSLWECRFWSAVDRRTRETSRKSLTALDMLDYRDLDAASASNAVVFNAIADVSGRNFVVDSSKLPGRLYYLMRLKGLDVYPVHLVREPKGQINSVVRKHGGFFKHIFRYELIHEQLRRALRSVPHSVVHYEDLVRDPKAALRSILQPLGLDFDPRQLEWAEAEKHEVAGNHMRFNATSELVLDESWRQSLSPLKQRAINLGTLLSRNRTRLAPEGRQNYCPDAQSRA
jgi:Sulfotransferase family